MSMCDCEDEYEPDWQPIPEGFAHAGALYDANRRTPDDPGGLRYSIPWADWIKLAFGK
jgi:hypothetical protein